MNRLIEKKFLKINGVETAYSDYGEGESIILLLHNGLFSQDGYCADSVMWEHNVHELARDCRVIALDMLGQGDTALPADDEAYSYAGMVAHVRDFLDAVKVKNAHLVGHDHGGMVALLLAIASPERARSCVIVNSPAVAPSGDAMPNDTLEGILPPLYSRQSQAWVFARQAYTPHHVYDGHLLDVAESHGNSEKFKALRNKFADETLVLRLRRSSAKARVDSFVHLREYGLKVPAFLIWGTEDPMSSTNYVRQWGAGTDSNSAIGYARAIFNLIQTHQPNTRMSFVSRAGYMPFRERPDVFNEIVSGYVRAIDASSLKHVN